MKNEKNKENDFVEELSVANFTRTPETVGEMLNSYGTYNIQPTNVNENDFPAIAQGETKRMKERPQEFFRGQGDENPAADTSKKESY